MNDQLNEAVEIVVKQPDHINEPASEMIKSADLRQNAPSNEPEIQNGLNCVMNAEIHDAIQVVAKEPSEINVASRAVANTGAVHQRANRTAANTTFLTLLVATLLIASAIAYYVTQRRRYRSRQNALPFEQPAPRVRYYVRIRFSNGATWTMERSVYEALLAQEGEYTSSALGDLIHQQIHEIAYDINRPAAPLTQVPPRPMHEIRNAKVNHMTVSDFRKLFSDPQSEEDPLDCVSWADWLDGNRGEDGDQAIRQDNPIVVRVCGQDTHWMKEEDYKKWVYKSAPNSDDLPSCGKCPLCRESKQEEFYHIGVEVNDDVL